MVRTWARRPRSKGIWILFLLFIFACGMLAGWRLLPSYPALLSQTSEVPYGIRYHYLPCVENADEAMTNGDYQCAAQYYRRAFGFLLSEASSLLRGEFLCYEAAGNVNAGLEVTEQAIELFDGWYDYSYYDHPGQVEFFVLRRARLLAAQDNVSYQTVLKKWVARTDMMGVVAEYALIGAASLPEAEKAAALARFVAKHKDGYWVGQALKDMAFIRVEEGELAEARRLFERALPEIGLGEADLYESMLEEEGELERLQELMQPQQIPLGKKGL